MKKLINKIILSGKILLERIVIRLNLFGEDNKYFFEFRYDKLLITIYRRGAPMINITMARPNKIEAGPMEAWCKWAYYQRHPFKKFIKWVW